MRFFFIGPRILGIRPGISFSPNDFRKLSRFASSAKSEMTGGFVYVSSAHPTIIVSDPFFERHSIPTSAQIAASNLS